MRRTGFKIVLGALAVSVLFGVLNAATWDLPAWFAVSVRVVCSAVALYGLVLIVSLDEPARTDNEV